MVTIIVLLILGGISVPMLSGDNNIIKKAGQAADETKPAAYKDEISLSSIGSIDKNGINNIEKVKQELDNTEKYDTSILGDTLIIITKKEKYVFEINQDGNIQFKGIKINTTSAEPLMMRYDGNAGYVLYIAANGKIKMINAYSNSLFAGFSNLTKINAANFDITSIANLWLTFKDCSKQVVQV